MRRPDRVAPSPARRGHHRALAIDAGASTIRLWSSDAGTTELTPPPLDREDVDRTDATADIVGRSRELLRRHPAGGLRRRRRGFPVAVAVPARAGTAGRRRAEAAVAALNRGGPVVVMDAPLAAAIGADVDVTTTTPRIVLDVGVRGSEAAVIADGRVITAVGCSVGCRDIERAVLVHVYRRHHVLAAPHAAWRALHVGSMTARAAGDDRCEIAVNRSELVADLCVPLSSIVDAVRRVVDRGHTRLGTDSLAGGLVVVGGGACLPTLTDTLQAELGAPVKAAANPRRAVIRGLAEFASEAARHPRLWDA